MALRYAGNTRRKSSRVAVVVSKKVSKSAVKRNRIRRRVYEVIRQYLPAIDQPHDIIFTIFDEQVAELSHPELTKLVGSQLKKAGII